MKNKFLSYAILLVLIFAITGCGTTAQIVVTADSSNHDPIHVSVTGEAGPDAARVEPGDSTTLKVEATDDDEETSGNEVILTISRMGTILAEVDITGKTSVTVTETSSNVFTVN